jgi:hypothetical protein
MQLNLWFKENTVKDSKLYAVYTVLREDETIQAVLHEIRPEVLPALFLAAVSVLAVILVCAL